MKKFITVCMSVVLFHAMIFAMGQGERYIFNISRCNGTLSREFFNSDRRDTRARRCKRCRKIIAYESACRCKTYIHGRYFSQQ